MELRNWFRVQFSENGIHLDVAPPGKEAWQDSICWSEIARVCYKVEGFPLSSEWYIFTSRRPESYVVPVEADGGEELLEELLNASCSMPNSLFRRQLH